MRKKLKSALVCINNFGKMGITSKLKTVLESIGKNNKPTYTVVAVAAANGIFKPLSSLTDKKEKPETKKYAALREFFTEIIAIPTYISCAKIAEKFADKTYKNEPKKLHIAKTNLEFVGVCTAAVFVIPAVCSLFVKPFTEMIYKKSNIQKQSETKIYPNKNTYINPQFNSNYHRYSLSSFTNRGGLKI